MAVAVDYYRPAFVKEEPRALGDIRKGNVRPIPTVRIERDPDFAPLPPSVDDVLARGKVISV